MLSLVSENLRIRKVRELLLIASAVLRKKGIENPHLESEIILAHLLNVSKIELYSNDFIIEPQTAKEFFRLIDKRALFVPIQYVTGKVTFWGYEFSVTPGVFIPRPETEILVENVIRLYERYFFPENIRFLDIGTGTGNIAISLTKKIDSSFAVATDISARAISAATKNALDLGVRNKVQFVKTSLFPVSCKKFHFVVSNPPYIPQGQIKSLQREVQEEPVAALNGGKTGLKWINKILENSSAYLHTGGFVLLEVGINQSSLIKDYNSPVLKFVECIKDLSGIERIIVFKKE